MSKDRKSPLFFTLSYHLYISFEPDLIASTAPPLSLFLHQTTPLDLHQSKKSQKHPSTVFFLSLNPLLTFDRCA